jgi:hypothetical protein
VLRAAGERNDYGVSGKRHTLIHTSCLAVPVILAALLAGNVLVVSELLLVVFLSYTCIQFCVCFVTYYVLSKEYIEFFFKP